MRIEASITIAELRTAIERRGGTLQMPENYGPEDHLKLASVEVDDGDVTDQLGVARNRGYYDDDVVDQADDRDVRDFVDACARGERRLAADLAPRLFASDRNQLVCETALLALGGRA